MSQLSEILGSVIWRMLTKDGRVTQTSEAVGARKYMPPQWREGGDESPPPTGDIYSMGKIVVHGSDKARQRRFRFTDLGQLPGHKIESAKRLAIKPEDREEFNDLLAGYQTEIQPAGAIQQLHSTNSSPLPGTCAVFEASRMYTRSS